MQFLLRLDVQRKRAFCRIRSSSIVRLSGECEEPEGPEKLVALVRMQVQASSVELKYISRWATLQPLAAKAAKGP